MLLKTLPSVFAFALLWAFVTAGGEDQASYGHTQGYFKKIEKEFHRIRENYGIAVGEVYASLVAPSWLECSTLCLEQQDGCALFSFRAIYVNETERNCYLYSRGGCDQSDYDSYYDSSYDLVRFDEKRNEILWETYLLIPLQICLAQKICNWGRCLQDNCEPEGYRCECDDKHNGKLCQMEINDFDLEFPSDEPSESYVFIKDAITSDMNEFTFATWFKTTTGLHEYSLLTYIVRNRPHIALRFETEDVGDYPLVQTFHVMKVEGETNDTYTRIQPVNDNFWHHLAFTWSRMGNWTVFIDGKSFAVRNYRRTVVPKGGVVYIGKNPQSKNAGRITTGFIGKISRLHLWDRALSGEDIEKMALNPSNDVGNVISWPEHLCNVNSPITKVTPSAAENTEKGLEFQFKFEASSSSPVGLVAGLGGISWPASEERKVLSVCFWLRTKLHTECMSHESEDRKTKYFAYGLEHSSHVFADVQGFRVSSTKSDEDIASGMWNFHCLTWNGKTGIFRFFINGLPFGNAIQNESLRTSLPKTGNITIGDNFTSELSFHPDALVKMSYLNVWSFELTKHSVFAMSAGGLNINGDVMAWRNVHKSIVGNIVIQKRVAVYFPGYTLSKKKSDWCNKTFYNLTFLPLFARFGAGRDGMQWRCYYPSALVNSKFAYDSEKQSQDFYTRCRELYEIFLN